MGRLAHAWPCRHRSLLTDGSMRQSPRSIFNPRRNASAAPSGSSAAASNADSSEQTRETMAHHSERLRFESGSMIQGKMPLAGKRM
jgi:hypothetical protein